MSRVASWPSHRAPSVGTPLAVCVLMFESSHRADGNIADALASTLAFTTANVASVNYSGCVPQRPEISSAPCAGIFICFVLVLAGRWCQCQFWHRHDYVFLDLRQHSYPYRVHSCSKSAHLPLRRLRAAVCARCLQGGGVYVVGGTVAILWCTISGNTAYDSVRAHV